MEALIDCLLGLLLGQLVSKRRVELGWPDKGSRECSVGGSEC